MDAIQSVVNYCTNILSNGGILFGFFWVFMECFIPVLPLSVFVTLNVNAYGLFLGVFISWLATCSGCFLCYSFFLFLEEKVCQKIFKRKTILKIRKGIRKFKKITLPQLVLLITLPFTPSFLINVISGIAGVSREKFLSALLIGKVFTIVFWGYIGSSLLNQLTDLSSILYICLALGAAYVLSKIVSIKMSIE